MKSDLKVLIIGGNKFFGKRLAQILTGNTADIPINKYAVTLLNRGNLDDGLGDKVKRIKCDRKNRNALERAVAGLSWDVVVDQVCYDANDALAACEIFKNKTGKYIFTSSMSVYPLHANLTEKDFDPSAYTYSKIKTMNEDYAEAKRQAESVFHCDLHSGVLCKDEMPVVSVRFPIVIGEDDPTGRWQFHFQKIKNGEPIYFPNTNARLSLIDAQDAAMSLRMLMDVDFSSLKTKQINCAAPEPVVLGKLIEEIGKKVGLKAGKSVLLSEKGERSPYGTPSDWTMNVDFATSIFKPLGFTFSSIKV